jgi:exonuclease SbcD
MRFLHTSDWHIGRSIKGEDRWEEVHALLEEIGRFVETQKVELVLISGDVFDVLTAPAEAEKIVYEFFCRMNRAQVPVVTIAGNHDSPQRFDSRTSLFSIADVYVVGSPRADAVFRPRVRSGAEVIVGALPFISEKSAIKGIDYMQKPEGELRGSYSDKIEAMIRVLAEGSSPAQSMFS